MLDYWIMWSSGRILKGPNVKSVFSVTLEELPNKTEGSLWMNIRKICLKRISMTVFPIIFLDCSLVTSGLVTGFTGDRLEMTQSVGFLYRCEG